MKKRNILTIVLVLLLSVACFVACGKRTTLDPYTDFMGEGETILEIDESMTIDGVLDERGWIDCKNKQYVLSKHALSTPESPKEMSVYTYFGEKAFYVAFEVKDNAIFYNPTRTQSRNTGVEMYFTNATTLKLGSSCYSLRFSPTGKEGANSVAIGAYVGGDSEWSTVKMVSKFYAQSTVDGTVNEGATDDKGYVIEAAISYDLLGGKTDSYQMTAAFVQTGQYDRNERYANTFLTGTSHIGVGTWKIISNDGAIEDKYAYLDANNAVPDDGMVIDGVLDESRYTSLIEAGKTKKYTHTSTGVTLETIVSMTDKGVYIGLECDDPNVYYNPDHTNAKFNTGAELLIVPAGELTITKNAVQLRYNVGGPGVRYVGNPKNNYPWAIDYVPMVLAGKVKGGEINTSTAEGWTGEIFIPWTAFGIKDSAKKNQIAIFPALYHTTSYTAESNATGWYYLAPGSNVAWGSNYGNNLPQETFFRFTKDDGFVFNGVTVNDVDIDTANVQMVNSVERYFIDVNVRLGDAVCNEGFTSPDSKPIGTFTAPDGVVFTAIDMGDGIYRLHLDKSQLELYREGVEFTYTNTVGGLQDVFTVKYDEFMTMDGNVNEQDAILGIDKTVCVINRLGSATTAVDYVVVPKDNAIYLMAKVTDADVRDTSLVSFGIITGNTLRKRMAYRFDFFANGDIDTYSFDHRKEETTDPWTTEDIESKCAYAVTETADGYFLEARISWDIFSANVDKSKLQVMASVRMDGNPSKSNAIRVYGNTLITNETWRNADNYINFSADGFAPEKAFAVDDLLYIEDEKVADAYTDTVKLSFVPRGGLETDAIDTKTFTEQEMTGNVNPPSKAELSYNGLTVTVPVRFIRPNLENVDESLIEHALDFNMGADDMQATDYTDYLEENKTGSVYAVSAKPLFDNDMAYVSNMRSRALRIPVIIGEDSFSVSMMIDATAVREHLTSHYSYVLIGTGNVDGDGEGMGFTVRLRGDGLSVRFPGSYYGSIPFDMSEFDGWRYLTISFNREGSQDTLYVYVDGKRIVRQEVSYKGSYDVEGSGKLGIGVPGIYRDTETGYTNKDVMLDNVVFYRGILNENNIYDVYGYVRDKAAGRLFEATESDFSYTFNDFISNSSVSEEFAVVDADGNEIAYDDITFTGAWASYVTRKSGTNTAVFAATADQIKQFSGASGYTVNGVTKFVNSKYVALDNLKVKDATVSVWRKSKVGSNYEIEVYVTANGIPVNGDLITFSSTELTLTSEFVGNGYFGLVASANEVEALTEPATVSVAARNDSAVAPVTFGFAYNGLTDAEWQGIVSGAEAHLDFENGIGDSMERYETSLGYGTTPAVSDGVFTANCKNNTVKIEGLSLGKDDFTIDFVVKLDAESFANSNANYELITSTITDAATSGPFSDGHIGTFQLSAHGSRNTLRLALGRNDTQTNGDNDPYVSGAVGALKPGEWQRITVVVDRMNGFEAGHFNTSNRYDANGNYIGEPVDGTTGPFSEYLTEENTLVKIYIDGVPVGTKTYRMSGQSLGDGNLYIGGNLARASKTASFDSVTFIRSALSDKQVLGLDSYYDYAVEKGAWYVEPQEIEYGDVTENQPVVTTLNVISAAACDVSLSSPSLENAGTATVALVSGELKLTIPYSELALWKKGTEAKYLVLGGIRKPVNLVYSTIDALYVKSASVDVWSDDIVSGNYVVPVTVYTDEQRTAPLMLEPSFSIGATELTATSLGNGKYNVSVPSGMVTGSATVTVTLDAIDGVTAATFSVIQKQLSANTVNSIAARTAIYYDFEGDFVNGVDGKSATYVYNTATSEASFDGGYYRGNQDTRAVASEGVLLGTDSFSVSMSINTESLLAGLNVMHHNNILFGTAKVDETENGISVRARASTDRTGIAAFQIKVMGTYICNKSGLDLALMNEELGRTGDARWTFTFDRDLTAKKMIARVYVNGVKVLEVVDTQKALDNVLDGNGNRIAIGGSATGRESYNVNADYGYIKYGDFMLVRGVLSSDEINGLDSYLNGITAGFGVDFADAVFSATKPDGSVELELELLKHNGNANANGITLVNAPGGVTLTESNGAYKLDLSAAAVSSAAGDGLTLKARLASGTEFTFKVVYAPVDAIYLDKTSVRVWSKDVTTDGYVITLKVSADTAGSAPIDKAEYGTVFMLDGSELESTFDGSEYTVAIPEAKLADGVEKQISVSLTGASVEAKTVGVLLNLNKSEQAAMLSATTAYLGFDGSLTESVSGESAVMKRDTASAGAQYVEHTSATDKALSVKTASSTVALNDTLIGKGDFTMAFDLRIDEATWTAGTAKANYELITSMNYDRYENTMQLSAHAVDKKFRLAFGRNDNNAYFDKSTSFIKPGQFQKIVLIVDRAAEHVAGHKNSNKEYTTTGEAASAIYAANNEYLAEEKTLITMYVDGQPVETKTYYMDYQSIGVGRIFFGGDSGNVGDFPSAIDNFTMYDRTLTEDEVKAIGLYYADYKSKLGVTAGDVTVSATASGAGEIALATSVNPVSVNGLPAGVTYADGKLSYTADGLAALKGETQLTAVFDGGVERAFSVSYGKIYASELVLTDLNATSTRRVKLSYDKAGTLPVTGATVAGATVSELGNGEYSITVPSETAEYAITAGTATGTLMATKKATLVRSTADPEFVNSVSVSKTTPTVQGGKVYQNVDLDRGSFTVSYYMNGFEGLPSGGSGQFIAFSTNDVDDNFGFTHYMSGNNFRFYFGGMSGYINISRTGNLNTLSGWHNVTVVVDRSRFQEITISVYLDFEIVGTKTQTLVTDLAFSLGENKQLVFGSMNVEAEIARNAATKHNRGSEGWHPGFAGQLVAPVALDISEVQTYMLAYKNGLDKDLANYTYTA